jgi:hypothetical protein
MTRTKISLFKDRQVEDEFTNVYKEINAINCPFGDVYVDKDETAELTTQVSITGGFQAITGFSTGELCLSNEMIVNNQGMTAGIYADGFYFGVIGLSFEAANTGTMQVSMYKNGVKVPALCFYITVGVANAQYCGSASGVFSLIQGDALEIRIKSSVDTTIVSNSLNFAVYRLAGT